MKISFYVSVFFSLHPHTRVLSTKGGTADEEEEEKKVSSSRVGNSFVIKNMFN
jgi:hypothetical protein